jgi:hypothetical protein
MPYFQPKDEMVNHYHWVKEKAKSGKDRIKLMVKTEKIQSFQHIWIDRKIIHMGKKDWNIKDSKGKWEENTSTEKKFFFESTQCLLSRCSTTWATPSSFLLLQQTLGMHRCGSKENTAEKNTRMVRIHQVQCCTVDSWFILSITLPKAH